MAGKEHCNSQFLLTVNKLIKSINCTYSCKQQDHSLRNVISAFVTAGHVLVWYLRVMTYMEDDGGKKDKKEDGGTETDRYRS